MKDWQDELFSTWETTVKEFEQLSKNLGELVENIGDEFVQTVDLIAEKIDNNIPGEIEQFLNELFQPLMDIDDARDGLFVARNPYLGSIAGYVSVSMLELIFL
jgi:hypothetical protein